MSYLIKKFKGIYRILCEYDRDTNSFSKKLDGTYEDIDCYIVCQNNIKIFHYGGSVLQAYIPSKKRGKNIIEEINKNDISMIFDIEETDTEILFKFKYSNSDKIIPLLKPKTCGANISPFSSKNLPRNKDYKIPDEELQLYKKILKNIPENQRLNIGIMTNNFIKTLATRRNTMENIKADMRLKGLKSKEYIHCIGKWNNYINYLKENMQYENN